MFTIYKITNTKNGKVYIGCTSVGIEKRWSAHKGHTKCGTKGKLYNGMRKNGIENFHISVICQADTHEMMLEGEIFFIRECDSLNYGYNSTMGGEGTFGYVHSEEVKSNQSASWKKCFGGVTGENLRIKHSLLKREFYLSHLGKATKENISCALKEFYDTNDGKEAKIKHSLMMKEYFDGVQGLLNKKRIFDIRKKSQVVQYSLDGVELARFPSMRTAEISTGVYQGNIRRACMRNMKAGGFIWKYVVKELGEQ